MTASRRFFPLLLATLPVVLSCGKYKVSQGDWDTYVSSLPKPTGTPRPPQYDTGTIHLYGNGQSVGSVYVWPHQNTSTFVEGFEITKMGTYRSSTTIKVDEQFDTAQRPAGTPLSIPQFDALMTTDACGSSDAVCVAKQVYTFYDLPADAPPQPLGISTIHMVTQQYDANCHSGVDLTGTSAYVYRSQALVGGAVKWTEHWFVRNTGGHAGVVAYHVPDHCQLVNQNDKVYRHDLVYVTGGQDIGPFYDQLKGIGCSGQAWCNFCGPTGSSCDHTQVVLDWYKRTP